MSRLLDRLTLVAVYVLGGVLVSLLVLKGWHGVDVVPIVQAQSDSTAGIRTVLVNKTRRLDPIEVTQVLEGASELSASEPSDDDMNWLDPQAGPGHRIFSAYKFQGGDSWLKDLTLVLRNRTSKNIARVEFDVTFPETAATGPMVWPTVRFGRLPANVTFYGTGEPMPPALEQPILFVPGQVIGFNFAKNASQLQVAVESRQPFASISLCYVHVRVNFDDGMVWTEAGGYAEPDPQHSGLFLPPARAYFPGPLMGPASE